jgi:hypothetical protein
MSAGSRPQRIQGKLGALTKKWWLYLALLLLFFLPIQAARDFDPRESIDLIGQVLSNPLIYALPILMPVAKAVPVVLIAGLLIFGNRVRRAFNLYVALLFLALAILQTTAVTDRYGLVAITGNLALILVVGLVWAWEVIVERNDFTPRGHRWWKWWVAPVAAVALLAPVDASTMSPDFNLARLLSNEAGLTFCMMTPVVLAVLTLYHPAVNPTVLRVSSFARILLGVVNMIVWFFVEPWGWWMGVLHIPLLSISIYGFVLGQLRGGEAARSGTAPSEG